jgi:DMSO/TMAO reductase YedYZ molybdopterin-dependent catalytic subunit
MRLPALLFLAGAAFAVEPALRIQGIAGRDGVAKPALELALTDIAAMPRTTLQGKTHDGKDHTFEGVAMAELLRRAGLPQGENVRGPILARYIVVSAHDGYRAIFSLPEFDPAFTDNRALLADKMDGQPLSDRDGPLRLVLPSEKREARWVRMVERIEILSAPDTVR